MTKVRLAHMAKPRMTREGKLRKLRKTNDQAIRDLIRRRLALPLEKRTNFCVSVSAFVVPASDSKKFFTPPPLGVYSEIRARHRALHPTKGGPATNA